MCVCTYDRVCVRVRAGVHVELWGHVCTFQCAQMCSCACMRVLANVATCKCMRVWVTACECACLWVRVFGWACVWVCVSATVCVCVWVCACVRVSVCLWVRVRVCVRVYANTHASVCVHVRTSNVHMFECDFVRVQVLEIESKGECMQVWGHASVIVHECEWVCSILINTTWKFEQNPSYGFWVIRKSMH